MTQIYEARRKGGKAPAAGKSQTDIPGPSIGELAAGARPSAEQMGRRVDLPEAVREKMEASFGADFSSVRLYESDTVAQAGAEAMTQGRNIAFAPGKLDLASTAGQALLGHELSHVVSQARGESAGHGFLANAGLEAQADRQGMLAAQGESVYSGPVTPIGTSSAVGASGPMQAKKKKEIATEALEQGDVKEIRDKDARDMLGSALSDRGGNYEDIIKPLKKRGYGSYIDQRFAMMTDPEEQEQFLQLLMGGNQKKFDKYVKKDVRRAAKQMTRTSNALNSEDFKERAAAYGESGSQERQRNAIRGIDSGFFMDLMGGWDMMKYERAASNFASDRKAANRSLTANNANKESRRHQFYSTSEQRKLRKEYRKSRRAGTDADRLRDKLDDPFLWWV